MVRQCVCLRPGGYRKNQQASAVAFCLLSSTREKERDTLGFWKKQEIQSSNTCRERTTIERKKTKARQWREMKSERSFSFTLVLDQLVSARQMLIVSWFLLYWFVEHEVWLNIDERTRRQRKTEHVKERYVYVKSISPVLRDKVESLLFFVFFLVYDSFFRLLSFKSSPLTPLQSITDQFQL